MPKIASDDSIEDLVDFYRRWPDLREEATKLQRAPFLTTEQASILNWMVLVIDRVGPADFDPPTGE